MGLYCELGLIKIEEQVLGGKQEKWYAREGEKLVSQLAGKYLSKNSFIKVEIKV